jgi:pimeloyl-ACP methyl ester carboxylesterase
MVERSILRYEGADGWTLHAELAWSPEHRNGAAALLVPATKHERDAFGPILRDELVRRGFTVMATDLRGRGDSDEPVRYHSFPPGQLDSVRADVAAALGALRAGDSVTAGGVVVMAEQDTADAVAAAASSDEEVAAVTLLSPRLSAPTVGMLTASGLPVCVVVSGEDRRGTADGIDAYAWSSHEHSRLRVESGLGSGTTMFSAWQYLHPGEPTLERWIASWAARVVVRATDGRGGRSR